MPTINEVCKKKQKELNISNAALSQKSGITLSTVNSFFKSSSKAPCVYTVGPICAALGISLDRFFNIQTGSSEEIENICAEMERLQIQLGEHLAALRYLKKNHIDIEHRSGTICAVDYISGDLY